MDEKKIILPKTSRGMARRQTILETAARLFREQGYANTSINAIVRQAGGSLATAYKWFPSKEILFMAVFEYSLEEIRKVLENLPLEGKNPETALRAVLKRAFVVEAEKRIRTFLLNGLYIPVFRENALKVLQESFGEPMRGWLEKFQERYDVRFRLGTEEITSVFIRYFRGTVIEFVLNDADLPTRKKQAVEQTLRFLLAMMETKK